MNKILELIDRLDFEIPYNASKGESGYRVMRAGEFELEVIETLLKEFDTLETKEARYELHPSKFRDNEKVLFKFKK